MNLKVYKFMEQQTAVEWLEDVYNTQGHILPSQFEQSKQMEMYQHGLFLHWFVKHYETATIDGMFGFVDTMGKEVTVKEIVEYYYSETYGKS